MLSSRLLINASARIGRLAAMSAGTAQHSSTITRKASNISCICLIASIRTLDNFPSTSTATKRKYTTTRLQFLSDSGDAKSAEPARLYGADTTADIIISTPSSEYEDYDLDNLEMPISGTTSMDCEDNSGCDSLDMDDVMSVRDARRVWDAEHDDDAGADIDYDDAEWYADGIEEEFGGSGGLVEMEEDWEVLHEQVHAGEGGDADAQAEEDGDVVIDW